MLKTPEKLMVKIWILRGTLRDISRKLFQLIQADKH